MMSLRAHLRRLSALWLAVQIAAMAGGTLVSAAQLFASAQVCTCPGGDHQTCPMHHSQGGGAQPPESSASAGESRATSTATAEPASHPDRRQCVLQNVAPPLDAALLSLTIGSGVLPLTPAAFDVALSTPFIQLDARSSRSRAELPDAPPPRA
jgi:hypothetical protein